MVEIAVKMVRLQEALGPDAALRATRTAQSRTGARGCSGSEHGGRACGAASASCAGYRPRRPQRRSCMATDGRRADRRRHPEASRRARDRVLLRAVRRHVRAAEREARPGREPRRPRHRRRRLRRLRRGRDRPGAERPGHRRDPRPRELHTGAVGADRRPLRLRHHRRRRGVAVRPAHDPAAPARAGPRARASSSRWASSSSTSSSSSWTTARSGSPTRSTRSRSPATT